MSSEKNIENVTHRGRPVGMLLLLGIVFIPYLFSWFTLRKGYSSTVRVFSLSWMVIVFVFLNYGKKSTQNPQLSNSLPGIPSKNTTATKPPDLSRLKGLVTRVDKVEGITWYNSPGYASNDISRSSAISVYLGRKSDRVWARVFINYRADDWLFIKSYKFLIEETRMELELPVETKVGEAGMIYEWSDAVFDDRIHSILSAVAKSKKTIIRYEGKTFYKDRTVSKAEKVALEKILAAYEAANP